MNALKNKNLRRISVVVTAQTLHHLEHMAAAAGYKDTGRIIDKLMRMYLAQKRIELSENVQNKPNRS